MFSPRPEAINREYYMSVHVTFILLNELRKRDKMRELPSILSLFFASSLMNPIVQEHECKILYDTKII